MFLKNISINTVEHVFNKMSLLTFRRIQTSQMEVKVGANGSNYPKKTFIQVVWESVAVIFSKGCWEEIIKGFSSKGSIYYVKMYEYA
jgi:hypothetical protein